MTTEQQDKLWSELSEESKEFLKKQYQQDIKEKWTKDYHLAYVETFGTHNLNPKPQIKTWEDVEKECGHIVAVDLCYDSDEFYKIDISTIHNATKVVQKAIATLKIAKLIELGYGGMVSEEENKDINIDTWCIVPCNNSDDTLHVTYHCFPSYKRFISFHTEQQAKEFMSYESNRRLVEQYYMM